MFRANQRIPSDVVQEKNLLRVRFFLCQNWRQLATRRGISDAEGLDVNGARLELQGSSLDGPDKVELPSASRYPASGRHPELEAASISTMEMFSLLNQPSSHVAVRLKDFEGAICAWMRESVFEPEFSHRRELLEPICRNERTT